MGNLGYGADDFMSEHVLDEPFRDSNGRAGDADGCDGNAFLVQHGSRDAADPSFVFLVIDGVALASHRPEMVPEANGIGDGIGCPPGKTLLPDEFLEDLFRQVSQQGLSDRAAMSRFLAPSLDAIFSPPESC